jgi:hypothetical protein
VSVSVNVKGVRKTEIAQRRLYYNLSGLFDPLFRGFFFNFFYLYFFFLLRFAFVSLITTYFISCSLFLFNVLSLFFSFLFSLSQNTNVGLSLILNFFNNVSMQMLVRMVTGSIVRVKDL